MLTARLHWAWLHTAVRNVGPVAWIDAGFDCLGWFICLFSLWKKWVICSGAEMLGAFVVTQGEKGGVCVVGRQLGAFLPLLTLCLHRAEASCLADKYLYF